MIADINRNTTMSFVRPRRSRDARRDAGTSIPSQTVVITTTEVALDNLSHSREENRGSESLDEGAKNREEENADDHHAHSI